MWDARIQECNIHGKQILQLRVWVLVDTFNQVDGLGAVFYVRM